MKHRSSIAVGTVLALVSVALADYLPLVGPGPLRVPPPPLLPPPRPKVVAVQPVVVTVNTNVIAKPVLPPKPVEPPAPPKPPVVTNVVTVASPKLEPLPAPLPAPPPMPEKSSVTPQMLVDFFKTGPAGGATNGTETTVVLPLGFVPPANATTPPPSSKATYSTPPAP